jgi:hypothetical protein
MVMFRSLDGGSGSVHVTHSILLPLTNEMFSTTLSEFFIDAQQQV